MTRGKTQAEHGPEDRRCIVSGESSGRAGLIRFVIGPDNQVFADLAEKLPGRGVWVTADRAHLESAVKKSLFARGFKAPVVARLEMVAEVEALLVARLQSLIGLARKSGQAIAGADKVKDWLSKERVRVLLQARDGSKREKMNLQRRDAGYTGFEILDSVELGMAFGRETVIHAALTGAGIVKGIESDAAKLQGFRR